MGKWSKRALIGMGALLLLGGAMCFLWYSPHSPYQYGQYIPADLDDAHAQLMKRFPPDELERIRRFKSEDGMVEYHFGIGMGIRNGWGLWRGSRLSRYFEGSGIRHPDDMSDVILETFWRKLHNKPIDLEEIAAPYREQWQADTLEWHLKRIEMVGFEMKDAPIEEVIEIFEKKFQDYRRKSPEAAQELAKTLFKIEASKPLLQVKATFRINNDLLGGMVVLSYCSNGLSITGRDIGFPVEDGQIVIRDGVLKAGDITNMAALVAKLRSAKDGVSQYLVSALGENARKELVEYKPSDTKADHFTNDLVWEFNRILQDGRIYDAERFAGITLSAEARHLLGTKPKGKHLTRLNRLLLEAAYPQELCKSSAERPN